jgi:hypothetical protein
MEEIMQNNLRYGWQLRLKRKLFIYLSEHNPDVLVGLQESGMVQHYLEEKVGSIEMLCENETGQKLPDYIVDEVMLNAVTEDLKPSRFHYVAEIFEEEFTATYHNFRESGVLVYEIINILKACEPVFEAYPLTNENEANRLRHLAVAGTIRHYLDNPL